MYLPKIVEIYSCSINLIHFFDILLTLELPLPKSHFGWTMHSMAMEDFKVKLVELVSLTGGLIVLVGVQIPRLLV